MAHSSISLFSGAGGIDCGLAAAGFETSVSVEIDRVCAASLTANRVGQVICSDVAEATAAQLLTMAGARQGEDRPPERRPAVPTILKIGQLAVWHAPWPS